MDSTAPNRPAPPAGFSYDDDATSSAGAAAPAPAAQTMLTRPTPPEGFSYDAPTVAPAPSLKNPSIMDHARHLAGEAFNATGSTAAGMGRLVDMVDNLPGQGNIISPVLSAVNSALPDSMQLSPETVARPETALGGAVGGALNKVGSNIESGESDAFKAAAAKPLVEGSLLHPSTLKLGAGISSPTSVLANLESVAGQAVPLVAGGLEAKGGTLAADAGANLLPRVASKLLSPATLKTMGIGAAQFGEQAGQQEQQRIEQMTPEELQQVPAYQQMVARGMSPADAQAEVAKQVHQNVFAKVAPLGAVAGVTSALPLLEGTQGALSSVVGPSRIERAALGAALEAPTQGTVGAGMQAAQVGAANQVTGENRDPLADSAGAGLTGAVMGGMFGLAGGLHGHAAAAPEAVAPAPAGSLTEAAQQIGGLRPNDAAAAAAGAPPLPGGQPAAAPAPAAAQASRVAPDPAPWADPTTGEVNAPSKSDLTTAIATHMVRQYAATGDMRINTNQLADAWGVPASQVSRARTEATRLASDHVAATERAAMNPQAAPDDATSEPAAAQDQQDQEPAAGTTASVPFMITNAMKAELRALGHSDADISSMTPEQAHATLDVGDRVLGGARDILGHDQPAADAAVQQAEAAAAENKSKADQETSDANDGTSVSSVEPETPQQARSEPESTGDGEGASAPVAAAEAEPAEPAAPTADAAKEPEAPAAAPKETSDDVEKPGSVQESAGEQSGGRVDAPAGGGVERAAEEGTGGEAPSVSGEAPEKETATPRADSAAAPAAQPLPKVEPAKPTAASRAAETLRVKVGDLALNGRKHVDQLIADGYNKVTRNATGNRVINRLTNEAGESVQIHSRQVRYAEEATTRAHAADIDAAAHAAAPSPHNDLPHPTEAQIEAGNYPKGHIRLHGMDISIENQRGSTRSGVGEDGKPWSHKMSDHYGYVRGTVGADGEHVDAYIGQHPKSDRVFVVDQIDQKTGAFDEHKALIGFKGQTDAVHAYRSNFDKGWKVGRVTGMSVDEFKQWMKGDTTKPLKPVESKAPAEAASHEEPKMSAADRAIPGRPNVDALDTLKKDKAFRKLMKESGDPHIESPVAAKFAEGYADQKAGEPFNRSHLPSEESLANFRPNGANPVNSYVSGYKAAATGEPASVRALDAHAEADRLSSAPEQKAAAPASSANAVNKAEAPKRGGIASNGAKVRVAAGKLEYVPGARETLEAYFKPDTLVQGYGPMLDKVLKFNWNDGNWNVEVQHVNKDGSLLADQRLADARPRMHSTPPDRKELLAKLGKPELATSTKGSAAVDAQSAGQKRSAELLGANMGDTVRATGQGNDIQAGSLWKIDQIDKDGTVHTSSPLGGSASFKRAELEREVRSGATFEKLAEPAKSEPATSRLFAKDSEAPDTPAFRKFFGESKVVDKDGAPLPVYHGTAEEFDTFDPKRSGSATAHMTASLGTFFAEDEAKAKHYAENASQGVPAEERVVDAYLSIQKPYEMSLKQFMGIDSSEESVALRDRLMSEGYDGIHLKDIGQWIAFHSNQIKSASENRGGFDTHKPNIYFRKGGDEAPAVDAAGQEAHTAKVKAVVSELTKNWKGDDVPRVQVVATPEHLPQIAKVDPATGKPDPSYKNVRGLYDGKNVWIVADKHADTEAGRAKIQSTLLHETVGHFGVERIVSRELGADAWNKLETSIDRLRSDRTLGSKDMRAVLDRVERQYKTAEGAPADRATFARETLAVMAEKGVHNGLLDRAVAAIRQFVRKLFPDMVISDHELRQLLVKSDQYLQRGESYSQRVQAQASMAFSRDGWDKDFPDAVTAHPSGALAQHPEFAAAKAGDIDAALRVARDTVTPEFVDKVKAAIPEGSNPIVVPVSALEATGENQIPRAAAEVLANHLGLDTDTGIHQVNKVERTGADGMHRLANQPEFAGKVEPGRNYVLLDDTLAQGGTMAQLKTHIEREGGHVVLATALTAKDYSRKIALDPDTLRKVQARYGSIESWWKEQFGHGFDGLTESEARAILTYDRGRLTPEALRNRVTAGKIPELERVREEATGDRSDPQASGNDEEGLTPRFAKDDEPGVNDRGEPDVPNRPRKPFSKASASIETMSKTLPTLDEGALAKLKGAIKGKLLDWEPKLLGALQLRHVLELAGEDKVLEKPAKAYADLFQRMDADRNSMTMDGAAKAGDLNKFAFERGPAGWAGKLTPEAKNLFGFMHEVTQIAVDPTQAYERLLVRDSRGEQMPWTQDLVKERIKALQEQMRGRSGDDKTSMMDEIKDLRRLPAREKARAAKYPDLVAKWNALSPKAQEMFTMMRDHYSETSQRLEEATLARIESLDIEPQNKRAAADLVRRNFADNKVGGVYFPLARFGDYFIGSRAPDRIAGEGGMTGVNDDLGGEYSFTKYETAKQAIQAEKQLRAAGHTIELTGRQNKDYNTQKPVTGTFMGQLTAMLKAGNAPDKVLDDVHQMFLKTLPELSLRKSGIHRANVAGYTDNVPRIFASNVLHGAHQIAKARFGFQLENTLEHMQGALDAKRMTAGAASTLHADALMGELAKRHQWILNPTNSQLATKLNAVGFGYYLAASPASALVNMSQGAMITLPVLGARHGWAPAMKEMAAATKDAMRTGGNIRRTLTDEAEKAAFDALERGGTFNRTATHSLGGIAEGDALKMSPVYNKVMTAVGYLFQKAEVINREAAGMAAFRLATRDGKNFNDSVRYADEIVNGTHFDYSNANRSRYMQQDWQKVLFQFKNYAVGMSWVMYRNLEQSLRGETPEIRAVARRTLTGILGMTSLFAGVMGTPINNLLSAGANAYHAATGDDDEPWDFNTEFRAWLNEHLGATAGGMIADGVVNKLGANVSSRLGTGDLWFRDADKQLEGADAYDNALESMAGPIGGIIKNMFVGTQQVNQGHTERGIETMMPTFIKNAMKSMRFATEGDNTLRGDPIVSDITGPEKLIQALGFQPTRVANQQRENSSLQEYSKFITDRRQNLMNAYAMAQIAGDSDAQSSALQRISSFNNTNPEVRISMSTLRDSLRQRARLAQQADNGIILNKKLASRVKQEVGVGAGE